MVAESRPRANTAEPPTDSGASKSKPRHFCPFAALGIVDDWNYEFYCEMRNLLQRRLRFAALVLFGGSLAFLIRNLLFDAWGPMNEMAVQIPHAALTVMMGAICAGLSSRWRPSLQVLRVLETLVFGGTAAFFLWAQDCRIASISSNDLVQAHAYFAETAVFWLLLMQIYGLSVPNTLRRATTVIVLLTLLPIVATTSMIFRHEVASTIAESGLLTTLVMHLTLGAIVSIYGSHRFGALRREAFDAQQVGSYTLKRKLGSGGMGEVYLAEHRLLKRPCAVKLIRPEIAGDKDVLARFESEVQAAAGLTHPNTIEIYDFGHTPDGTFYYVMEYLPGLSLQEMIERFGPIGPHRLVHLLRQVCQALREAHKVGLIHRDIKPGNIFAAERGGVYDVAKLLDFGLVKSLDPSNDSPHLTTHGTVVGSPQYAAPEAAIEGRPDARSDIYSLGATAYYLLTGQPVFPGENTLKVLFAHVNQKPELPSKINPDVPTDLEAVVMKCLEKDPADRFADVVELEEALAACSCRDCWTQEMAAEWWSGISDEPGGSEGNRTDQEITATIVQGAQVVEA